MATRIMVLQWHVGTNRSSQTACPPPAAHHLTVHTPAGRRRCAVESAAKLRDGIATVTVTVLAGDWLDLGAYPATYEAGDTRVKGSYAVYDCRSSTGQILFVGTFTREGARWA